MTLALYQEATLPLLSSSRIFSVMSASKVSATTFCVVTARSKPGRCGAERTEDEKARHCADHGERYRDKLVREFHCHEEETGWCRPAEPTGRL
ncbi:MAG: hypothetical protein WBE90_28440 [Xanthobacteraceae bacterium]